MIIGFHHAAISTPDMDRCLAFYKDVVGCEEVRAFEWPVGTPPADEMTGLKNSAARAVLLKLGDTHLEVFEFSSPKPATGNPARPVCDHGITHICLLVTDLRAEYDRLKAAGMHFHSEPLSDDAGLVVYGRDPDGNVVELAEFTSA